MSLFVAFPVISASKATGWILDFATPMLVAILLESAGAFSGKVIGQLLLSCRRLAVSHHPPHEKVTNAVD